MLVANALCWFCRDAAHFMNCFVFQDLSSQGQYDAGVALNGLSCFITPDLARDLANDIMTLVRKLMHIYQQNVEQKLYSIIAFELF
jgi:hypothetical protein